MVFSKLLTETTRKRKQYLTPKAWFDIKLKLLNNLIKNSGWFNGI